MGKVCNARILVSSVSFLTTRHHIELLDFCFVLISFQI
jgi:hypothetical protein